jgi:hypothetical protein
MYPAPTSGSVNWSLRGYPASAGVEGCGSGGVANMATAGENIFTFLDSPENQAKIDSVEIGAGAVK